MIGWSKIHRTMTQLSLNYMTKVMTMILSFTLGDKREGMLRTCVGSSAAAREEAEKRAQTLKEKVGSIHKVTGE